MRILLLGGNGFLGQKLQKTLEGQTLLIPKQRLHLEQMGNDVASKGFMKSIGEMQDFRPDVIFNLMASWGKVSEGELWEANHLIPLAIAEQLNAKSAVWLQFGSYFQYYFDKTGIDYDSYSMLKRLTLSELKGIFRGGLVEIRLPMLLGKGSRHEGLVSALSRAIQSGEILETSSGDEILPLRHVWDVSEALSFGLRELLEGPPDRYVPPSYQLSVNQLILEMERYSGKSVLRKINRELDRPRKFTSEIEFKGSSLHPPNKKDLEQILGSYLNKS